MLLTKAPEQAQAEADLAGAQPRPPITRERIPFVLCQLLVLGWVVRDLAVHAEAIRRHVGLPFQVDYEEGNILNALVRITHGLTPYPDPHAIPNILNPYGPVAYYLLAVPVKLFGVSFLWPRLVIVACVAAICCFVGLTVARLTGSALTGLAFGAMYGTLPVVESWSAVLRVDFLALALSTTGVYLFIRGLATEDTEGKGASVVDGVTKSDKIDNRQSTIGNAFSPSVSSVAKPWFSSAALFVAALFVKYTYVAAPAACFLYLLAQRRWKPAAWFAGFAAALAAALLLLSVAATRGTILTHLFRTHADLFSTDVYLVRMTGIIAMCRVLAVLAAACLIPELLQRSLSVPALWLLIASGTAVTAGKVGSNWNHFLEWPAALCLCAGIGWTKLTRIRPRVLATVAGLAATAWLCIFLWRERSLPFNPYATVQDCSQAYAFVKQYPGDQVLSENVGALVLAGKTVWVSNPFVYTQLVMRGGWPDAGLERMVRARRFDLIVAQWNYPAYPSFMRNGAERFSSRAVKAIAENYRVVQMYGCTDARVMFERK
ncbi:MAG: hypothetical protein LAN64_03280 [Acidobacteriia bacterium]|nr:hypothetical protein [Terriglobia bacterium]